MKPEMYVSKKCFKCNIEKPIKYFYKHKEMADGHLNKCIECTKKDTSKRHERLIKNPEWHEKEKERHRKKYYRLGYKEKHKRTPEQKKVIMDKYKNKYPEKVLAKNVSSSIPIKLEHRHHWSYNPEHYKSVIHLTESDHAKLHRFMIYDQERMMYRRAEDNVLLDTIERHIEFMRYIDINNFSL